MIVSRITGQARVGLLLLCASVLPSCGGDSSKTPATSRQGGNPSVSQDGRVVVFESDSQAVIVDRVNATSFAVGENDSVANAVVTPDGRFVAFDARPPGVGARQVFLRDLTTGVTTLVSATPDGLPGAGDSTNPTLSDDGRFIAFQSASLDLGAKSASSRSILVSEVATETILLASPPTTGDDLNPSISGNGQFVAFESRPVEGFSEVLLWNRLNGQVLPASRLEGAALPDGGSGEPSLNFDGRLVAFESRATNLTPASPDTASLEGESNILVRDVLTGTLAAASVPLTPGAPADGDSRNPTISRDGRRVAFESTATNLTEDDVQPGESNVFVRDLSSDTTQLVTAPEEPPAEPAPVAPSGLTTSTPVLPTGTADGRVTGTPVPGSAPPTPPPPETTTDPVASGDAVIPTPGVVGDRTTSTPVQPTGIADGRITGTPVPPLAPASGLTTGTPVQPTGATGGLVTSTPVQPIGPESGRVTGTPVGTGVPVAPGAGITVAVAAARGGNLRPSISPDGAWVAFESGGGIYLADLQSRRISTIRVK